MSVKGKSKRHWRRGKKSINHLLVPLKCTSVHMTAIISTFAMRYYCSNILLCLLCVCVCVCACVPTDKLLSLLPEYVVPYTIHLLAHDPDYVKVQDIEQLKEIKE